MPTVEVTMWPLVTYTGPDTGRLAPLGAWVAEAGCADLTEAQRAAFTTDRPPTPRDAEPLAAICGGCPVLAACDQHAATAGELGWWGGRWHGVAERTEARQRAA